MIWWATIDFKALIENRLPACLREEQKISFINSVVGVVGDVYEEVLYKMQHNGQVIYLEKMLNEWFATPGYDSTNHQQTKTVYIEDAPKPPTKYIYLSGEIPPNSFLYLGTQYLTGEQEWLDFIVFVPLNYQFNEIELRTEIDFYKEAGKKYAIQLY